jgi:dTDP-6-deoxy-L-talose 4-dehydrogenase (NAD+)
MKKIIVTGASGFIGKSFCKYLLDEGLEVYGVARNAASMSAFSGNAMFHAVKAGYAEYKRLGDNSGIRDADAFVHFAWNGVLGERNNYRLQIENILGSAEAATAAAAIGAKRFVFADSAAEQNVSVNPKGITGPCNHYGAAKASARQFCRIIAHENAIDFVGVSLSNIIGPPLFPSADTNNSLDKSFTNIVIKKMLKNERADLIEGRNLHDFLYIDDAVRGIYAAMSGGRHDEVYYLGSNRLRPFRDFIVEMRDVLGSASELWFGAFADTSFIDYSGIYLYKLHEHTGFVPQVEFAEGIKRTARFLARD